MKKLFVLVLILAVATGVAAKVRVFHPVAKRAGLMSGDSVIAEAAFDKIGVHDANGYFYPDSIRPAGYTEAEFGGFWNIIDTCGNVYFDSYSPKRIRNFGPYFYGKFMGKDQILTIDGKSPLTADRLFPVYSLTAGGCLAIVAVTDSAGARSVIYDANLRPMASFEDDLMGQDFGYIVYLSAQDGYERKNLISLNARGQEGRTINGGAYFVPLSKVTDSKEMKKLRDVYTVVPPLVLVKNSEKYNSIFFLDSLLTDKAPRVDTFEKSAKKVWKKIKPMIYDPWFLKYYNERYVEPAREAVRNAPPDLTSAPPAPGVEIADSCGKKMFTLRGLPVRYNSNRYDDIERVPGTNVYLAWRDSTCRTVDRNGTVVDSRDMLAAEKLPLRSKYGETALLKTYPNGKAIVLASEIFQTDIYDDIIFRYTDNGQIEGWYALKDGRWAYAGIGKTKHPTFYDYIDEFDASGNARVYYQGYSGVIDTSGKKVKNVCSDLYNSAFSGSKSDAERIAILNKVTDIAGEVDEAQYLSKSYRTIAELYEKAGYVDDAITAYEFAEMTGDSKAGGDAKRLKNEKIFNALNQIANSLNNMAAALGGNPADYNISAPMTSAGGSGSYSAASSSSAEGQYRNWERRAKGIYESLTGAGYKVRRNGKETGGSASGNRPPSSFIAQKRLLREAQDEMAKIRREAARDGVMIPQSEYESVSVSF